MHLSIITAYYNRPELFNELFEHMCSIEIPETIEVHWIIIDDCSKVPLSSENLVIPGVGISLLRNEINLGKQNCLNRAFDLISEGYVTVIDSDDFPLRNMLMTFNRSVELLKDLGIHANSISFLNVNGFNGEIIGDLFERAITVNKGVNGGYRINKFDRHGFFQIEALNGKRYPVSDVDKDFISESYLWMDTWTSINVGFNIVTRVVRYQPTGYTQSRAHLSRHYRLNQRKYYLKKMRLISIPIIRLKCLIRVIQTF